MLIVARFLVLASDGEVMAETGFLACRDGSEIASGTLDAQRCSAVCCAFAPGSKAMTKKSKAHCR